MQKGVRTVHMCRCSSIVCNLSEEFKFEAVSLSLRVVVAIWLMMATAASRARALALYRKLLRTARVWPGPPGEKQYILTESRVQFEANRHLSLPEEIDRKIFEGEARHDIAWHYKIPYPRLHNFPAGSITENPSRVVGPTFEIPSEEMGSLDDEPSKPSGFRGRSPSSSLSMRA